MLLEKDLKKMTVNDLKNLCVNHGLDTSGLKVELIQRLLAAQSDNAPAPEASAAPQEPESTTVEAAAAPVPQEDGNGDVGNGAENGSGGGEKVVAPKKHSAIVFEPVKQTETTSSTTTATASAAAVPVPSMSVTAAAAAAEEERLKQRAARFGIVKESDRLKQRAERFGLPNEELDKEKKRKRADRFDIPIPEREEEKKKHRAMRFNITSEADKRTARAARFQKSAGNASTVSAKVSSEEEAKRKARAARFGA